MINILFEAFHPIVAYNLLLGIKSTLRFAAGELVFVRPHQDDLLLAAHGIHTLLRWAMVWY